MATKGVLFNQFNQYLFKIWSLISELVSTILVIIFVPCKDLSVFRCLILFYDEE